MQKTVTTDFEKFLCAVAGEAIARYKMSRKLIKLLRKKIRELRNVTHRGHGKDMKYKPPKQHWKH